MNFMINIPRLYGEEISIDDELHKFCSYISRSIDVKKYTDCLDTIGIVPIIASKENVSSDLKDETHVSLAYAFANASVITDLDEYVKGDQDRKKELITDNILRSVKNVKNRIGKKFDFDNFEKDLLDIASSYSEDAYWKLFK